MTSFRDIVLRVGTTYLRGEITWTTSVAKKTRGGKFYSEHISHNCKDAILRHVSEKTVEITLPDGQTFRKQKRWGFAFVKVRSLKPNGYKILLKKRTKPK
jgi:hypothetical protein